MWALVFCLLIADGGQPPYSVDQPPPPPLIRDSADLAPQGEYQNDGFHFLVGSLLAMGSDTAFPRFVGPISNPWLAKDPRSLSEARLLGVFNFFPDDHPWQDGFGQSYLLQIRAAINKRWSVFLDKSGHTILRQNDQQTVDGWNNLALGTKYQVIRDVEHQFMATVGLQYEAPTGEARAFQRPGDGSLTVFTSVGQEFWCFWHVLGNVGARIPLSDQNSTLLYSQVHVDRELFGWLYPLVECNWYHIASDGQGTLPSSLGQGDGWIDWAVPGTAGSDLVTAALGLKIKCNRNLEAGVAYEKSLTGGQRLLDQRVIAELIFRY
jgi:hypothetical protein